MADIFETAFQNLLGWEGDYGVDAKDPGGPTRYGVIQEEYDRDRRERGLPTQSVKFITLAEAESIYRRKYWTPTRCDELNPGVADATFDASVNSGNSRGVRWLQQAINAVSGKETVKVDEDCGPITVAAANALDPGKLIDDMLARRLAFMKVARHPKTGALLWLTFGKGWTARINGVRIQAHKLAGVEPTPIPQATKEATMAAAATVSTAGVNVSTGSIVSHMLGSFSSAVVAFGAPLLSIIQGTTWGHYIAGGLFGIAGGAALVSNVWQMVTNNKNASNNTLAAISDAGNLAAQILAAMQSMQAAQPAPVGSALTSAQAAA